MSRNIKLEPILHTYSDILPEEQIIVDTYHDHKQGLISKQKLRMKLSEMGHNFELSHIEDVLRRYNTYNQNKIEKKAKHFSSYEADRPFSKLQMDLAFMIEFANANDGHKYIITVIDTFSRYAFAYYLKDKTSREIIRALNLLPVFDVSNSPLTSVFDDIRKISEGDQLSYTGTVQEIICDKGTEFMNKDVLKYLNNKDINIINPKSQFKAAIVERFNRTLKQLQ